MAGRQLMRPLRSKAKVGFTWKGSSATPEGGRDILCLHASQSASQVLPMPNFMHWDSDTLKQQVSLLPPQPRMEGTAFLGRQKNSLVGT